MDHGLLFVHKEYLVAVDLTSHVGIIPLGLPLPFLCDLPMPFVYFQVNNGVLYFLDYCEDIYIMVSLSSCKSLTQMVFIYHY